jgi:hypothetical protein
MPNAFWIMVPGLQWGSAEDDGADDDAGLADLANLAADWAERYPPDSDSDDDARDNSENTALDVVDSLF